MSHRLPPPGEIRDHYNDLLKDLDGEYIQQRWGENPIARRHFRQTELAIAHGLKRRGKPGDVLEIGCGPAVWTTLFLEEAQSVHLADISEEMLRQARARISQWQGGRHAGKVEYTCGDFLDVELAPQSFDTIVTARAFEYMSNKQAFVSKCFSLLRPGGVLLLVTKNRTWHDSVKVTRWLSTIPREEIPVGRAMQLDLVDWRQTASMFKVAGFVDSGAYPVILGTYEVDVLASRPALAMVDLLHRSTYRQRLGGIPSLFHRLMESFLIIGRKPA